MENLQEKNDSGSSTLVIAGDYLTDVLFPTELRSPLVSGKETLSISGIESAGTPLGAGGVIYVQDVLRVLLDTHFPQDADGEWEALQKSSSDRGSSGDLYKRVINQIEDEQRVQSSKYINHWTIDKRDIELSKPGKQVYRVIDKLGSMEMNGVESNLYGLPKLAAGTSQPSLLVIADYGQYTRNNDDWNSSPYHEWLTCGSTNGLPNKIIMLGGPLPTAVQPKKKTTTSEPMWAAILGAVPESLRSTLVVTSIERLRQEGANVSKRMSWDRTLIDFKRELNSFPPLMELGKVGHLIVRIGVVGAIHCCWTNDGKRDVRLLYHPCAKQGIFRDRVLQGNSFAIRSMIPSCIAFHVWLRHQGIVSNNLEKYDTLPMGAIRQGIKDGIHATQAVYAAGFGPDLADVREYLSDGCKRREHLKKAFAQAHKSSWEARETKELVQEAKEGKFSSPKWFTHVVRLPKFDEEFASDQKHKRSWNILRDNYRCGIKGSELRTQLTDEGVLEKAAESLFRLETLRRLRAARGIAFLGVEAAMNNTGASPKMMRQSDEPVLEYLEKMLKLETQLNKEFSTRTEGEVAKQELTELLLPEWKGEAFPLNGPVNQFGKLTVLGKTDMENYSSIRNLITAHLSGQKTKPISIAVFGEPGSGKSFGITEIASVVRGYWCNLLSF